MSALHNRANVEPHIKVAIHGRFYRWAKEWTQGKTVLDAGCGQAHGTAILAESAAEVTGVDIDDSAVANASNHYTLPNVKFGVMDCEKLSFARHSFDVVVSNALLEYLRDVGSFFEGAQRVLKPGGLFICGTKNLLLSLKKPDGTPRYNNHRQEYTPESLAAQMERYFSNIRIYGEQMNARSEAYIMDRHALKIEDQLVRFNIKRLFPRRLRRYVRKLVTGVELNEVVHEDFEIVEQDVERALYIIGVGIKGNG